MKILHPLSGMAAVLAFGLSAIHAAELSGGGYHSVRVDGGAVKGLGDGTYGQLGTSPAGSPATVVGLGGVTAVAAGGFSTLALKSDGTVWFLGEMTLQHTTAHGTPNPVASPIQIAGLAGIDAIAAGHRHYLALDANTGNLYAWGHNGSGQVGNGGLRDLTTPVVVLTGVSTMAAGDGFSLAVKSDGSLWAWGRNAHGQLGLGDTADRLTPTQVPGITTAEAMAAGGQHSLILLANDTLLATGNNSFGQLGLGNTASVTTPTAVPGLSGVAQISAGYFHSAALAGGNQVFLWGRNHEGQCGGGGSSPVTYSTPQLLAGLAGSPTGVECGYHFTLIEFADGSIAGTGSNSDGQLDGASVADQANSHKVLAPQITTLSLDLTAPSPDPMSFASPPAAVNGTSITMTATLASDLSGPVEYFFGSTTPGGNDSGWQLGTTYLATGLTPGVTYTYQVKARDAAGNETGLSAPASATPLADTTPPAITSLSPANGSFGVATSTQLVLAFDEAIQKASGSVIIKKSLGNVIVATIDVAAATVIGSQLTIGAPLGLDNGTSYYIEVTAGAIQDLAGNPFSGIAGSGMWSFVTATAPAPSASLMAHYPFDVATSGTTPDSVGSAFASLGNGVAINTGVAGAMGTGVLDMTTASGSNAASVDGAVTSNSFSWASDARTITFWWKAKTPAANTTQGTYFSSGTTAANGTRFDIKESNVGTTSVGQLRVEVQGAGHNTNPTNFDDGNWHFVALTVPNGASFADISWFAGVRGGSLSGNLNTSTSTQAIATGTGPLVFGDSIITGPDNRTPNGYLDDFQLYNEVLSPEQIGFIYQNPGQVIGTPSGDFTSYISNPAFGIDPAERGFSADPDADNLASGLEAWFGTHPGEFTAGITGVASNGVVTTFTHPQNENRPADVIGFYQWSPNLVDWYAGDGVDGPLGGPALEIVPQTVGTTTTVIATASEAMQRIFLRAGVVLLPAP